LRWVGKRFKKLSWKWDVKRRKRRRMRLFIRRLECNEGKISRREGSMEVEVALG